MLPLQVVLVFLRQVVGITFVFGLLLNPLFGQQGIDRNCTVNVNCLEGYSWKIERNSSVYVLNFFSKPTSSPQDEQEKNDFVYAPEGSATLLSNNKGESRKYYLLTAAHLIRRNDYSLQDFRRNDPFYELPRVLNITVNFQNQYCPHESNLSAYSASYSFYAEDYRNPTNNNTYKVLVEGQGWRDDEGNIPEKDYALIELSFANGLNFAANQGLCFTGWDATPTLDLNSIKELVHISHPGTYGFVNGFLLENSLKKVSSVQFSPDWQTNSNTFFTFSSNKFETGWIGEGASGCGIWGKNADNSQTELIGIFIQSRQVNGDCRNNRLGMTTRGIRYSYIWNDGQLWRFLDKDRNSSNNWIVDYCPPPEDCFDGKQNQGEDHVDCCNPPPNGCTVCPPCVPPLGNGGNNSSCRIIFSEEFDLLQNCYNGNNSFPQVRFRINSNCLANMCLAWKESGQETPTGDINPIPQRVDIGERGQIRELTYTWDFHGGLPQSFPVTKTYTLYVYDFGCTGEPYTQIDFPITIYGSAVVNAGNDLSLCVNQTEQLNGQFQGGNYYTNAFWRAMPSQAIGYLSNPSVLNPTLTPTQTGTYTYTLEIRDGMNCSGFDEIVVTVDNITRPAELRLGCVVPPDYYHAGRIYTAETCSTTITAPEPTDFVGAQEVNLLPGFTASAGATFTARIAPCDVDENAQAPPPEPKTAQKAVEKPALKPNSFSYDLFPNPTDGIFTLRYTSTDARLVNVRLYDNIGRLLTETSWQDQNRDFEVDVSRYSAGLYHVYVSDGRQTVVKKLFKR